MSVPSLATGSATDLRHPAIDADDSMLLLCVWSVVWSVLVRAEKEDDR